MSIISNTTVLSNFASIGHLMLLQHLFGMIAIPTEVYEEIHDGKADGYMFYETIDGLITPPNPSGWIQLVSMTNTIELQQFQSMPTGLHHGEAACLAIAQQRQWMILTDDRAARAEASRRGIHYTGSIGCLVLAVDRDLCSLDMGDALLHAMIAEGYYAPVTTLRHLIRRGTSSA